MSYMSEGGHAHARKRAFWSENGFFRARPGGVEDDIVNLVPFAVHLVGIVVDGIHFGDAAVSVVVQRILELGLFGGELFDDLVGRRAGRADVHGAEPGIQWHRRKRALILPRSTGGHRQAGDQRTGEDNGHADRGNPAQTVHLRSPMQF